MEYETFLEIEDSAQEAGVFINPNTGQHAHSDAYGTVIDFEAFEEWWKSVEQNYTVNEWREFSQIEKNYVYLSPVIGLFDILINRKIKEIGNE